MQIATFRRTHPKLWCLIFHSVYAVPQKYGFMTYLRTLLGWSVECSLAAHMRDGGESEQAV